MHILFQTIPALAREFSGGSKFSAILICFQLWYFEISRKFFKFENDFTVHASFDAQKLKFHLRYEMDLAVLTEIFINKEYDWFPVEDPKIIIDLGAHFGDTALYYHSRFPEAKIFAVEPSPENFARLVKHTVGIENIIPIQAAVGSNDGEITLHLMPSSLGHSVKERNDSGESVIVKQISLATLFQQQNIKKADLIKFDIEGAEFDVLRNINLIDISKSYIGELHFDLTNDSSISEVENIFKDFQIKIEQLSKAQRYTIRAVKK